jgi:hypothetical protein
LADGLPGGDFSACRQDLYIGIVHHGEPDAPAAWLLEDRPADPRLVARGMEA